jgi:membrane-bound lytic murein transglycosylase MltF
METPAPWMALACAVLLSVGGFAAAVHPAVAAEPPATETDVVDEPDESDVLLESARKPWTGDLDGMVERRMVRILTAFSKTFYFLDKATQRGVTYELGKAFEDSLNKSLKTKALRIHVVFIPVSRDRLIPDLVEGRGDIAAANLTITPERLKQVDFAAPVAGDVKELVVTGPASPPIATIDDLAGKEIVVRKSSSYYESLVRLNERFSAEGKPEMRLTLADEDLEDEDLMEMVSAELFTVIVVDSHKARFWAQVFPDLKVHEDIAVNTGGEIAWALRKNGPKLKKVLDRFAAKHKVGTTFGNIVLARYLKDAKYVTNATSEAERTKLRAMVELFRKYAGDHDLDWLLVAAQAYQESRLEQSARSHAGAVGVMQIKPSTAAGAPINITGVDEVENNIHAGVKYLRFMVDEYFADPAISPLDRHLFAFAGYNAGPNRINRLRQLASKQGLDPNKWLHNVEVVVAKKVGRETTQYVGNIHKYYIAYKRLVAQMAERSQAREAVQKD